nr:hypothetical protein GCM10020093_092940 [Planobispora longispora]
MSPVRRCSRTACSQPAVFTLTYVYADSTAVLGPLATYAEPHCYDLCAEHAERLTAPRGWEVVRLPTEGVPPSTDDLEALANAVREAARPAPAGAPSRSARPSRSGGADICGCSVRRNLSVTAEPSRVGSAETTPRGGAGVGDLARIFKAYDVRGVVPDEFDEATAEAVGAAFVEVIGAGKLVLAHDMRSSSEPLAAAFARGRRRGAPTWSTRAWAPPTCSTTPAAASGCPA